MDCPASDTPMPGLRTIRRRMMAVYHEIIPVETDRRVSFEDVTEKVQDIVKQSGIRNGLVKMCIRDRGCCTVPG